MKYVLKRFSGKRADVEKIRNKKTILVFVNNVERIKKKSHIHKYIATYKRIYMHVLLIALDNKIKISFVKLFPRLSTHA